MKSNGSVKNYISNHSDFIEYPSWFCKLICERRGSNKVKMMKEEGDWYFSLGEWVAAILEISFSIHYHIYLQNGVKVNLKKFSMSRNDLSSFMFLINRAFRATSVHEFLKKYMNDLDYDEVKKFHTATITMLNWEKPVQKVKTKLYVYDVTQKEEITPKEQEANDKMVDGEISLMREHILVIYDPHNPQTMKLVIESIYFGGNMLTKSSNLMHDKYYEN